MSSIEARMTRTELAIGEMRDKFEDTEERIEGLDSKREELREEQDSKREELREEMQGVLNESMDALT